MVLFKKLKNAFIGMIDGGSITIMPHDIERMVAGFQAGENGLDFQNGGFGEAADFLRDIAEKISSDYSEQEDAQLAARIGALADQIEDCNPDSIAHLEGLRYPLPAFNELIRSCFYLDNLINKHIRKADKIENCAPGRYLTHDAKHGARKANLESILELGSLRRGLWTLAEENAEKTGPRINDPFTRDLTRMLDAVLPPDMSAPAQSPEEQNARLETVRAAIKSFTERPKPRGAYNESQRATTLTP